MTPDQIRQQIEAALPGATVDVRSGDNVHFEALVIAPQFEGARTLARHQLVYRALGSAVGGEIHALSLDTPTPAEWSARKAG
jgi:acid stress-induced BolA-like protein IbaG/YrbA